MQNLQISDQFEQVFQNSEDFLEFMESTFVCEDETDGDKQVFDDETKSEDMSIYSCQQGLDENGWKVSLYSLNEILDLETSNFAVQALVINANNDFEIMSVNAEDFKKNFKDMDETKVMELNRTYFSNEIMTRTPEGELVAARSEERMERVVSMEDMLRVAREEDKALRRVRRARKRISRRLSRSWQRLGEVVGGIKRGLVSTGGH